MDIVFAWDTNEPAAGGNRFVFSIPIRSQLTGLVSQIGNGKIVEICVAAGEVVAGGAEEVEDLTMISTAAVVTMAVKIATIEVEVADMMMMVVGEVGVVVITTDMMVTAADIAALQAEGMEMDP